MSKKLKFKIVCTDLPGRRFEDPYDHEPIVVELKLTDDKGIPLCATPSDKHITWENSI